MFHFDLLILSISYLGPFLLPTSESVNYLCMMWESESDGGVGGGGGREYGDGVLSSNKHGGVKTDGFELRGQSW